MSLFQDIRQLIEIRLLATTGFPAVAQCAFENISFVPTIGTAWARGVLMPVSQRQMGFGATGLEVGDGAYMVSLFFPFATGSSVADSLADAVRAQFKPPLVLTQGSTSVTIISCDRKGALTEADFLHVPLVITFKSLE